MTHSRTSNPERPITNLCAMEHFYASSNCESHKVHWIFAAAHLKIIVKGAGGLTLATTSFKCLPYPFHRSEVIWGAFTFNQSLLELRTGGLSPLWFATNCTMLSPFKRLSHLSAIWQGGADWATTSLLALICSECDLYTPITMGNRDSWVGRNNSEWRINYRQKTSICKDNDTAKT